MALPADITGFTLVGQEDDPSFAAALAGLEGTLTAVDAAGAPVRIVHLASGTEIVAPIEITIGGDGSWSVGPLPFTDQPGLSVSGFQYLVKWNVPEWRPSPGRKQFSVPTGSPSTVYYSTVGPSPDVPTVLLPVGQGPQGDPGEGVPAGGTTGQILAKASGTDFDTAWITNGAAPVTSVNGKTGAVALSASDVGADVAGAAAAAQTAAASYADSKTSAEVARADAAYDPSGAAAAASAAVAALPTVAHTGAYADLTGKPTLGTASSHPATDFDTSGAAAAAQAFAVQRANHTGTQSADTLTDGATNKAFLATERTKLAGVATGATAVTVAAAGTAGAALSATDATTTNARTPTAHASTHASAGSDPVSIASTQVTGLGSAATQPTSAFDPAGAAAAVLPTQTGNSGKYLTTNGTAASWGTVAGGAGGLLATIRPPVGGAITPGHVASINSLGTLGNLVLGQMIVPLGTYDAAICRVATPAAGATVKIVAYAYDTTNTVGSLLFETASVAATSGGYLSVALPSALVVSAAQVVWIGLVPQGSAASTFWATQQGLGLPRITGLGSSIDLGGVFPPSAITVTGVTAAAPTSPTITWTDNHNFRIALHRSA